MYFYFINVFGLTVKRVQINYMTLMAPVHVRTKFQRRPFAPMPYLWPWPPQVAQSPCVLQQQHLHLRLLRRRNGFVADANRDFGSLWILWILGKAFQRSKKEATLGHHGTITEPLLYTAIHPALLGVAAYTAGLFSVQHCLYAPPKQSLRVLQTAFFPNSVS